MRPGPEQSRSPTKDWMSARASGPTTTTYPTIRVWTGPTAGASGYKFQFPQAGRASHQLAPLPLRGVETSNQKMSHGIAVRRNQPMTSPSGNGQQGAANNETSTFKQLLATEVRI